MDYFLILFGAGLGFALTQLTEWIRRYVEWRGKAKRLRCIALDISKEALQGVTRCKNLAKGITTEPQSISFGRIYTALWDSIKDELARDFDEREILRLFHRIYHRFELVNFNLQRNAFGPGASFAKTYLEEMIKDLENILARL